MSRPTPLALLAALALACVVRLPGDGASSATATTTTGDVSPSTGAPTTADPTTGLTGNATTGLTTADPDTGDANTTCGFVCDDTTADPPWQQCDPWIMPEQDCPEGQKCTFDGAFGHTHCVDIVPEPKDLYEPCAILRGGQLGDDDCAAGLVCWDVDPETGIGACIGFCLGSSEAPTCADPSATCAICQECDPSVCLPGCDPLAQDCPDGNLCLPYWTGNNFLCVLDASGAEGQAFDPCEFSNACDPGLLCADPALATECDPMAAGCCLPFCDLTKPTCPGDGLSCVPWYDPGTAPPGHENVGLCGLAP